MPEDYNHVRHRDDKHLTRPKVTTGLQPGDHLLQSIDTGLAVKSAVPKTARQRPVTWPVATPVNALVLVTIYVYVYEHAVSVHTFSEQSACMQAETAHTSPPTMWVRLVGQGCSWSLPPVQIYIAVCWASCGARWDTHDHLLQSGSVPNHPSVCMSPTCKVEVLSYLRLSHMCAAVPICSSGVAAPKGGALCV